jgi:hypothetical protein
VAVIHQAAVAVVIHRAAVAVASHQTVVVAFQTPADLLEAVLAVAAERQLEVSV